MLFGLGIRYVGETVAKRLASAFHSMQQLQEASLETLTEVDEIGERIARSVVDYFADENNRILVARLQEYGLPQNDGSRRSARPSGVPIN
ncbi:MAG: helix-hairpin-helix domain-containing protein [Parabacteroides sp.]